LVCDWVELPHTSRQESRLVGRGEPEHM
jgi:hypothetical protein